MVVVEEISVVTTASFQQLICVKCFHGNSDTAVSATQTQPTQISRSVGVTDTLNHLLSVFVIPFFLFKKKSIFCFPVGLFTGWINCRHKGAD